MFLLNSRLDQSKVFLQLSHCLGRTMLGPILFVSHENDVRAEFAQASDLPIPMAKIIMDYGKGCT